MLSVVMLSVVYARCHSGMGKIEKNLESQILNLESQKKMLCSHLVSNCVGFLCSVQKLLRLE